MIKNILKFAIGGIAIAVLGAGALLGVRYLRMQNDPEYRQMQEAEKIMGKWERQYREDTYGGATPEETLRLFIEALQKGDTDLAAKYFVPDEREKWKTSLEELKRDGVFDEMIKELNQTKLTVNKNTAYFTLARENDLPSELIMHKNLQTGVWKITEL